MVSFPYGKEKIEYCFDHCNLKKVIHSSLDAYKPDQTQQDLIAQALAHPIHSENLAEMAKGKNKIVIIASDHTRPVPSQLIIPPVLEEIRKGNPDADITILIATGCHRGTTREELIAKFGQEIVDHEKIIVHDCDDTSLLTNIGTLPSGGDCVVNAIAADADLLIAEGFIEPHFFAGFSGGRKSVLPGICARETVLANHCSEFIASEFSRTGILENNPIHKDMVWAAEKIGLAFIINVIINSKKEVINAFAGNPFDAHLTGCDFLSSLCYTEKCPADIVITTNGGYPLDQNLYQAVKGMTAGEATVRQGGAIIMLAKCNDGVGGEGFYHQLADEADIEKTMGLFLSRKRNETVPDQWQTQIFLRILQWAKIILVSEVNPETVKKMHMIPAFNLDEAIEIAKTVTGKKDPEIVAIPDGVSVVIK